jgi:ABC-type microcin C transport system permease subunit YejB
LQGSPRGMVWLQSNGQVTPIVVLHSNLLWDSAAMSTMHSRHITFLIIQICIGGCVQRCSTLMRCQQILRAEDGQSQQRQKAYQRIQRRARCSSRFCRP